MINIGVVGCGYWGPNLTRNFHFLPEVNMLMAADLNEKNLRHLKESYPNLITTTDYRDITNNPEIDAVAVATPALLHYKIAMDALNNNKHVFIEKPMATSKNEVQDLINISEKNKLILMAGHILEYTVAVRKIKEIIDSGELGEIYYISSQRLNLGLFQQDINVIWDLASHDISIILYLLGKEPKFVSASGASHINPNIEDVGLISMEFDNNLISYIHTSWLYPNKIRKITIFGSKKMLVFDDVEPSEKIKIYYKGVDAPEHYDTFGEFQYTYRYGDITIPMLKNTEPLNKELEHFRDCIIKKIKPDTDGESSLRVIKIL